MSTTSVQRIYFTPNPDTVSMIPGSSVNVPSDDGIDFSNFRNLWLAIDANLPSGTLSIQCFLLAGGKWHLRRRPHETAASAGGDLVLSPLTGSWKGIIPFITRIGSVRAIGTLEIERIRLKLSYSAGGSASGDTLSIVGLAR